jgi:hypothetical protein
VACFALALLYSFFSSRNTTPSPPPPRSPFFFTFTHYFCFYVYLSISPGDAQQPPAPKRNQQRRPSMTFQNAANSPFNPNGTAPQAKSSVVVHANNPTFTPDVHSPFSNAPLPKSNRQSKANNESSSNPLNPNYSPAPPQQAPQNPKGNKTNVYSQQSPFKAGAAPPPQIRRRDSKVNITSTGAAPISFNPNAPVPQARRTPPKANHISNVSPFNPNGRAPPAKKPVFKVQHAPGGRSNVNLFDDTPVQRAPPKQTATYATSSHSPLHPNPSVAPQAAPKRSTSRVNLTSTGAAPISYDPNARIQASNQQRPQPQANVPSTSSPFSNAPQPRRPVNTNVTRTTSNEVQHRSSTRVHAPPGGRSNITFG